MASVTLLNSAVAVIKQPAIEKTKIKEGGSVPIILYLQKWEMGWI